MHYSLLQADKYGVPRMCFINKMDRMGANFYKAVDSIVNLLGAKPCILQVLLIHACCANYILRIYESSSSAQSAAFSRCVRARVSKIAAYAYCCTPHSTCMHDAAQHVLLIYACACVTSLASEFSFFFLARSCPSGTSRIYKNTDKGCQFCHFCKSK